MAKHALGVSLTLLVSAFACRAGTWTLPGIDGHAPSVWVGERNWTQELGNPMPDQGASWGLDYQTDEGGDFTPMIFGLAYNYTFAWRSSEGTKLAEGHGDDPACHYIGTTLASPNGKTFPGDGPNVRVTIQSVNPGPSGCGKCSIAFKSFKVTAK